MANLLEMFKYTFMQRALLVGSLISVSSAILGVVLVLKRYSMIGDGLSHVAFGAISIGLALGLSPLMVSIPIVIVAAFLLLRISNNTNLRGDAAIGMISSGSLAIGIIVTSLSSGLNANINNYMFGSVLTIENSYVWMSIIIAILVIGFFSLYQNRIFSVTFDENFSRASGVPVAQINLIIALLTAFTVVIGIRIMGALLISSLIVFPTISAMKISKSFKNVIVSAAIISLICFVIGLITSFLLDIPTGAMVVVINIIALIVSTVIGKTM